MRRPGLVLKELEMNSKERTHTKNNNKDEHKTRPSEWSRISGERNLLRDFCSWLSKKWWEPDSGIAKKDSREIPFTQSFDNCLFRPYYAPGSGEIAVNQTAPNIRLVDLTFLFGEITRWRKWGRERGSTPHCSFKPPTYPRYPGFSRSLSWPLLSIVTSPSFEETPGHWRSAPSAWQSANSPLRRYEDPLCILESSALGQKLPADRGRVLTSVPCAPAASHPAPIR